jgi:hypothetical protein
MWLLSDVTDAGPSNTPAPPATIVSVVQPMEEVTADSPHVTYAGPSDAPPPPPPPAPPANTPPANLVSVDHMEGVTADSPDVTDAGPSNTPAPPANNPSATIASVVQSMEGVTSNTPAPPANNPSATIVSVDQSMEEVTSDSPDDFLDLYNIDKNIDFLSKFLYDMIDFSSTDYSDTDMGRVRDDVEKQVESERKAYMATLFSDRPIVMIKAIRYILITNYYYSTDENMYNKLFEILTGLGKVPISKLSSEPLLANACTKYKEATIANFTKIDTEFKAQFQEKQISEDEKRSIAIEGEDDLYININNDTDDKYERSSPIQSPTLLPPSSKGKAEALTKKKNKQRKKNKQSRKKGNVKNKRSRKIKQRKKIKYSKRKKHGNSKQSKRKKHGNHIKIKEA